ncbi:hypothetical protein [Streptomyces sp. NPDC096311]|uniref:hypothetical protein n=1 Tax=Streptomyces sp. NPDC096311 TaxID=3366083 RepID=UPI00382ED353
MGTAFLATLSPSGRDTLSDVLGVILVLVVLGCVAALVIGAVVGWSTNAVEKFRQEPLPTTILHSVIFAVGAAIAWVWLPTGTALLVGAGVSLAILFMIEP